MIASNAAIRSIKNNGDNTEFWPEQIWHFSCDAGPLAIQNIVFAWRGGESYEAHTPVLAGPVPWLGECDHLLSIHKRYLSIKMESGQVKVPCWFLRGKEEADHKME